MSEITLDSDLNQHQLPKRPTLLTVMCILTWVGSGLALLGGVISFVSKQGTIDSYNELKRTTLEDSFFGNMPPFEQYSQWNDISNGFGIVIAVICIYAAVLMFQQKKIGFFIYLAATIVSLAIAVVATNYMMPSGMIWIGMIIVGFTGFISATFLVLYGVNLKYMR